MDAPSLLTKTRYLTGRTCPRKMWFEAHRPVAPDRATRWRMEEGMEVSQIARDRFPDGEFISGGATDEVVAQTERMLTDTTRPLFEAAFRAEGLLARVDILRPTGSDGWTLTEVKSTTRVGAEEKRDVAFQKHVLERVGIPLAAVEVMHLNAEYRHPDDGNLFTFTDLTGTLDAHVKEVNEEAPHLCETLQQEEPPEKTLIRECDGCDYQDRCWDLPEHSVFTLPRLHWQHVDRMLDEDRVSIDEIAGHALLKRPHERYIDAVRSGEPFVDRAAIREALSGLTEPLHFLDFEAIGKALPWLDDTRPWQPVPFQYSLHILDASGTLEHYDYLHDGDGDPRPGVGRRLVEQIHDTGSVIAYHTAFEERCLETLREGCPRYEQGLRRIAQRLWDQRDIFSSWAYLHPEQKGSTSLKMVLPALTDTTYDDLGIREGMEAVIAYENMADPSTPQAEKRTLRSDLRRYCKRDTKAMVDIHRALVEIVNGRRS